MLLGKYMRLLVLLSVWLVLGGVTVYCDVPMHNPCEPFNESVFSSKFGNRELEGEQEYHKGLDIAIPENTPVYAAWGGKVQIAGWSDSAGNWVVIDHGGGTITKYMHGNKVCCKAGDTVKAGDKILESGNTGRSFGAHLHFQVEVNGQPVDPLSYTSMGSTDENSGGNNTMSREEMQSILDEINKAIGNRSASLDDLLSIYQILSASGFKNEQCCAFLLNGIRESSLKPDSEGTGGFGIWGFTHVAVKKELQEYSKEKGDQKYTLMNYKVGGTATQVAYMVEKYMPQYWEHKDPKFYNTTNWSKLNEVTNDSSIDYSKTDVNYEDFKSMSNPVQATVYFLVDALKAGQSHDLYKYCGEQVPNMMKLLNGASAEGNTNEDLDNEMANLMVETGIWDETMFVKWKVMTGNDKLEFKTLTEDLHEDNIYDISTWLTDIEKNRGDNLLIKGGRWLAILLGILFEIWMLFMYLAYWFDRLNNFFDFSLLNIVSFGRLRVSPDENECTFSVKALASSEVRTINHKKLLGVVVVGLGFGTMIISGVIFTLLRSFVNTVLSLVG